MEKKQNYNHPEKGSKISVQPIKEKKDITLIKTMLRDKPLDFALFVAGINLGLRAGDLVSLKVDDVKDLKPEEQFEIKEGKSGKNKTITVNKTVVEAFQIAIQGRKSNGEGFLFSGQRGKWTIQTVHAKVKSWCKTINLKGNYGSHTLRKTFGFQMRMAGHSLPQLTQIFNHSSQKQTLQYLCIQPEELKDVYMTEI
ncbi:tyrosine-type recombinase/integrase [Desulfobacterales bacterium HSG17]|nr:tyrosine-type recombinase/integrase [Desulfobacterales bacterium HSG17]